MQSKKDRINLIARMIAIKHLESEVTLHLLQIEHQKAVMIMAGGDFNPAYVEAEKHIKNLQINMKIYADVLDQLKGYDKA